MESDKHSFWWLIILIADLVVINLLMLYLFIRPANIQKINLSENCDKKCQENINLKLKEISDQLENLKISLSSISVTPVATEKPIVKTVVKPRNKVRTTTYVNISGSGSTLSNSWVDISGTEFYFDTRDFPGLVNVYFESNMKLFNGNGLAFIRLFDSTHGVGVQGSEVQTNSQSDTIITSGQVSFYAGKNLIKVQARSLTADTTIFNSGRLKITTEN